MVKPILIKRNARVGSDVTILPDVTIRENAVMAIGVVVSKDIPDNIVVAGVPAKIIRSVNF